jgi:hypothetical protein
MTELSLGRQRPTDRDKFARIDQYPQESTQSRAHLEIYVG